VFSLPAFADYKPIPKELSKQYKKEIENTIKTYSNSIYDAIDNDIIQATKYFNILIHNEYDIGTHVLLVNIAELRIPSEDMDLYHKLMEITIKKYLGEKYIPIPTDSTYPAEEFILPYLKDNKINMSRLNAICRYQNKKIKLVEKYLRIVQKMIEEKK
jgi:hypothetical protein